MKIPRILGGLLALGALSASLAAQTTVHVRAWIDGRSRLILAGDTAQWQHFEFAAPGRLDCDTGAPNEATWIDGNPWWPNWADLPTCENRDCNGCTSDLLLGIAPALPLSDFQVQLLTLSGRGSVTIVETPSAGNGYRVVIEILDEPWGGADWYEFDVSDVGCGSITRYCSSTPNSTGLAATIGMTGSLSVSANAAHLLAFQCPPSKPGIFLYGSNPTQIPFANGFLCISPFTPGLHRVGAAQLLNGNGAIDVALDFQALPSGAPIQPGTTWNFQFWYRDLPAGGAGSNLSDALSVTFCP